METKRIMVCVRKGISPKALQHSKYTIKNNDALHVQVYEDGQCVAKGSLCDQNYFGPSVKMIQIDEIKNPCEELYQFLVAHLAHLHDQMHTRYPSYIVLEEDQIDETAWLAHLGFTPFLGAFEGSDEENSKTQWEKATQALRQRG